MIVYINGGSCQIPWFHTSSVHTFIPADFDFRFCARRKTTRFPILRTPKNPKNAAGKCMALLAHRAVAAAQDESLRRERSALRDEDERCAAP